MIVLWVSRLGTFVKASRAPQIECDVAMERITTIKVVMPLDDHSKCMQISDVEFHVLIKRQVLKSNLTGQFNVFITISLENVRDIV